VTAQDLGPDPFGTSAIRAAVLAAWAASPARFREDANAEEDLALGAYRDRVVVELAQNAADAAGPEGGRLLLRLTAGEGGDSHRDAAGEAPTLVAANTGSPLDEAGVQALATLRASAKRDGAGVGRFGVGFAAVLGVSDAPAVLGRAGGVRFSATESRALAHEAATVSAGLADELARRGGHAPVLRLPLPAAPGRADDDVPEGYDTAVVLPLRDAAAVEAVRGELAALDDGLLLALPALTEIAVELPGAPRRVLRDAADRWRLTRRDGTFGPGMLADRPTEERERTRWSLTWALPRDERMTAPRPPAVLHAPTPSDEPLDWPALLVATFPLDTSRRHVAPGPATDALVAEAAATYAALLNELAAEGREAWRLVPTGFAAGALDGALREALLAGLPMTPLLPSAEDAAQDAPVLLRPRDAVALDGSAGADADVVRALAPVVAGLVHAPRAAGAVFALLGVRRIALADVVEQVPPPGDPQGWLRLYAGLSGLADDALAREALAALPVPVEGGRVVRGARGGVLPAGAGGVDGRDVATALGTLGVRALDARVAADPAVRRFLERLGARAAGGREALDLPEVGQVVAGLADDEAGEARVRDDDGQGALAAVLTLVGAAVREGRLRPGELAWLAGLPLPDADGDPAPARELVLPRSPAARLLDPREVGVVEESFVARWGEEVLRAVGVLDSLSVFATSDMALDTPPDPALEDALDGVGDWLDQLADLAADAFGSTLGATVGEVVAVRDLDLVREDAWPEVLDLVAATPELRAALLTPVRLAGPAGGSADAPSYTAWWLREQFAEGGAWADPDAAPGLEALLPPAPPELARADPAVRAVLGAVRDPGALDAAAVQGVLAGLADPAAALDVATVLRVWAVLAELADAVDAVPPERVRVLAAAGTEVVDAEWACVVGDPMLLQRADLGRFVVGPGPRAARALADLLDLPLAAELARGVVDETGARRAEVPAEVRALLPGAATRWCEHDELLVDGAEVDWWVDAPADGLVHAATLDGLARALAFAAGAWDLRWALADLLLDPAGLPATLVDQAFGGRRT
jgi:hypothetical protein